MKPVTIDGKTYPSKACAYRELASHIMSHTTFYSRLKAGVRDLDTLLKAPFGGPYIVGGESFANMAEAVRAKAVVPYATVASRLYRDGMTFEEACLTPSSEPIAKARAVEYNGEPFDSLGELWREHASAEVSLSTFYNRINLGWDYERALKEVP